MSATAPQIAMNAHAFTSDVAFTPTVKAIQARKGSRHGYASDGGARRLADQHHA